MSWLSKWDVVMWIVVALTKLLSRMLNYMGHLCMYMPLEFGSSCFGGQVQVHYNTRYVKQCDLSKIVIYWVDLRFQVMSKCPIVIHEWEVCNVSCLVFTQKMCAIALHCGRQQCEKRSITRPSLGTLAKPFNLLILVCSFAQGASHFHAFEVWRFML